jgi:lysyl-tRNA synthetase class 2
MASLKEIRTERLDKLNKLKAAGQEVFPVESGLSHTLAELQEIFSDVEKSGKEVTIGGRIKALRGQGALIFCDLDDGTGAIQILLKKGETPATDLELFEETTDLGDIVSATGTAFLSKRGEKTILVKKWQMLAKSLRPLPDKWEGLKDTEERFRRRYLDSLMDPAVKKRFILRSQMIVELRRLLDKDGFLEVETPMLQPVPGGATAAPFVTHHNALDLNLYLRVAPELYLKKMMIGGFPKVYELSRCFRNEGIDTTHNPEFTSVEVYASYSTPIEERKRVETIFRSIVQKLFKQKFITHDGQKVDFSKKFAVMTFFELLQRYAMISNPESISDKDLKLRATQLGVKVDPKDHREKILDNIYKKVCRPKLIQPVFITDYPVAFAPLAKRMKDQPELIDRFQLVAGGMELVNGFSELNDPIDQRGRFEEQEKKKKEGDEEAQVKDEDFIEALEHGMPPACGWAIGIDRLAMLLTDTQNIREVIYFPTLRPKE